MWTTTTTTTTDDGCVYYTEKSYKRPPLIFPSSSENKTRSIKIHVHMNNSICEFLHSKMRTYISHRRSMSKGTLFS